MPALYWGPSGLKMQEVRILNTAEKQLHFYSDLTYMLHVGLGLDDDVLPLFFRLLHFLYSRDFDAHTKSV